MKPMIYVLLVLLIISVGIAQENEAYEDKDLVQLMYGLNSQNDGVRESSVYLAGKYRIREVSEKIREIFFNDSNSEVRKMAVHSLFIIDGKNASDIFLKAALSDKDTLISFLCCEYYHQLTGNKIVQISR